MIFIGPDDYDNRDASQKDLDELTIAGLEPGDSDSFNPVGYED